MLDNLDVQNKKNMAAFGNTNNTFGMNFPQGLSGPQMQAQINTETINEAAKNLGNEVTDSYVGQRLTAASEVDPAKMFGLAIPTWFAVNLISDAYSNACKGDYSKSLPGKFGAFGDKIGNFLLNNPIGRVVNSAVNKGKDLFKRKIYDNSALVRAFDKTPSHPDLHVAKQAAGGMPAYMAQEVTSTIDNFLAPAKCAKDLDYLGFSKAEISQIESRLAGITEPSAKELLIQTEELKKLSSNRLSPAAIQNFERLPVESRIKQLKELKVTQVLGFDSLAEFEAIKGAPEKFTHTLVNKLSSADNKYFARNGYSDKNFLTKLKGKLFGRKTHFSEIRNKLLSSMGSAQSTALGRGMAKLPNVLTEGLTGSVIGGKVLGPLMTAPYIAEVLIRANRQETVEDKFKSFIERFAELVGFFAFQAPAVKLMHKFGGLQYSGMTPDQIENYRRAVDEFNAHVMNKDWTRQEYRQQRKILRSKFRPKTWNPFVWAARKCADILTVGLEQVRPYSRHKVTPVSFKKGSGGSFMSKLGCRLKDVIVNPKYWFKQALGYPVRIILPFFIIVPFFNKILVKCVNAIFGKPKEGALADEKKMEKMKEEQEQMAAESEKQRALFKQQILMQQYMNQLKKEQSDAKLEQPAEPQPSPVANSSAINHQVVHSPIKEQMASDEKEHPAPPAKNAPEKKTEPMTDNGSYIPSTDAVILDKKTEITDEQFTEAIRRADEAEKRANKILSGQFKY